MACPRRCRTGQFRTPGPARPGDARAVIRDPEDDALVVDLGVDVDARRFRLGVAVLDAISDDVLDELAELFLVDDDGRQIPARHRRVPVGDEHLESRRMSSSTDSGSYGNLRFL